MNQINLFLIRNIINNVDLLDNLYFRILNKKTKNLFDNNSYWLDKITSETINYKYFIKKDEEISHFDLYFRIDQMTFPVVDEKYDSLCFVDPTLKGKIHKLIKFHVNFWQNSYNCSIDLIFLSRDKVIKSFHFESDNVFSGLFEKIEREVDFEIQPYYKNITGSSPCEERDFCSRLIKYNNQKRSSLLIKIDEIHLCYFHLKCFV